MTPYFRALKALRTTKPVRPQVSPKLDTTRAAPHFRERPLQMLRSRSPRQLTKCAAGCQHKHSQQLVAVVQAQLTRVLSTHASCRTKCRDPFKHRLISPLTLSLFVCTCSRSECKTHTTGRAGLCRKTPVTASKVVVTRALSQGSSLRELSAALRKVFLKH